MKLYQNVTEKQLRNFLKKMDGTDLFDLSPTEIKTEALFGDFICHAGYKFKKVYSDYQCMETPTERHVPKSINVSKGPNDYGNRK